MANKLSIEKTKELKKTKTDFQNRLDQSKQWVKSLNPFVNSSI